MDENAKHIVFTLRESGHEAVFAGGCVRDFLMGKEPKDIDIATSATPDEIEGLFPSTIPLGKQFGIIVVVHNGKPFEVATFRTDSKESDGRRPDSVVFSSMEEDAKRRDLTINALFLDPFTNEVFDFVGGKKDIENRMIRFVGNPDERIEEDKLRILRAIRFGAKYEFDFEAKTEEALSRNAHRVIGNISEERIKDELEKMMKLEKPSSAFNALWSFDILGFIMPEIDRLRFSPQSKRWHSEGNVWKHTMLVLNNVRNMTTDTNVLWAALFHDVAKPHCMVVHEDGHISNHGHEETGVFIFRDFSKRFKFSTKERETISFLIKNHMKPNIAHNMKKSTLRKLIAEEHFEELIMLCEADNKSAIPDDPNREDHKRDGLKFLKKFASEEPNKLPPAFITGRDLIALGMKPGPEFKRLLGDIFELQLNGFFEDRLSALKHIGQINLKRG